MQLYKANGDAFCPKTGFDVLVAASDSREEDKVAADYVCTGSDDQIVIQTAIDSLTRGGTVYLSTGNYYIDGWSYDNNGYKCAICVKNSTHKHIRLAGTCFPIRKVNSHDLAGSAILRVRDTAISKLTGTETRVSVIGYGGSARIYPAFSIAVENLGITLADNQHPIICIDGKFFSAFFVKNVMCGIDTDEFTTLDSGDDYDFPVDGCIAIRGTDGANFGAGYRVSNCFVFGFGVAYLFNGEHLIAEQLGCRFCNYSYRFGHDVSSGSMVHDLTLINCCHEFCARYPVFNSSRDWCVNLYDYNIEDSSTGKFATVSKAIGAHRGRIYYTVVDIDNTGWVNANVPFWEEGYGSSSITVNTAFPT